MTPHGEGRRMIDLVPGRRSLLGAIALSLLALGLSAPLSAGAQNAPEAAPAHGPQNGPHDGPPNGPPAPAPKLELTFPPPPDPLTQDYVSMKFIYALLAGQTDTLKTLFAPDVRPYVTEELTERLRSQFNWLYGMIGGDFEQFLTGGRDSAFFREYRLANESSDRSPLIVIQVVFPDSVKTELIGAQVKNFLGGNEKRLGEAQTWKIDGQDFDIHSVILAHLDTVSVLAIQFFDESKDTLSMESVKRIGVPLIKEAIARGFVDSARTKLGASKLADRVGVVFIRHDKRDGFGHYRIGYAPEDFGGFPDAKAPGKKSKAPKAAPAKKKTPAKK